MVQVRLAVVVEVVPLGTLEMAPIQMRHNVGIVNWVKQHRLLVPRLVRRVTRVKLGCIVVIVWLAPVVFTKTKEVKHTALNVDWEKRTLIHKQLVLIVTRERLAVVVVIVWRAPVVFIKTIEVKHNALNVNWEKRTSMHKRHVLLVTSVNLAVVVALVQHAHVGIFKTAKDKTNAVPLPFARPEKYPIKTARVVNCHRGVGAKLGNI